MLFNYVGIFKKSLKLNGVFNIILSIIYSLIGYNIVYSSNIMWLDSVIWLPIVLYGVDRIIICNKNFIFTFFLFITIISNFYTGYMVGIFTVLYFIFRLISRYKSYGIKVFLKENKKCIIMFIISCLISILLASVILLPTAINLMESKLSVSANNFSMNTFGNILDLFSKFPIGSFNQGEMPYGPPNIFVSMFVLILVICYFKNNKIRLLEKISIMILLTVIIVSFNIIGINNIWHMLQSPVYFPYRYSFIFSFILIYMAARTLKYFDKVKISDYYIQ